MVTVPEKFQPYWPKTQQETLTMVELGVVLKHGMQRILSTERFSGDGVDLTYQTNFPMPDGTEWEVTVRRRA